MKTHGISSSSSGRNTATPGPSAPSTPGSSTKTASAKKRKIMHSTEDADDDEEVKTEVKAEAIKSEVQGGVKMELEDSLDLNGSYINPNSSDSAAAATLVTMAEGARPAETNNDDEVYLICATEKMHDANAAPPVYSYHSLPPLESCPIADHNDVAHHSQAAQLGILPPYEYSADFHSQKVPNALDPVFESGWINAQDPIFFWNDMVGLDAQHNIDHA